jgi:hypothetical protein
VTLSLLRRRAGDDRTVRRARHVATDGLTFHRVVPNFVVQGSQARTSMGTSRFSATKSGRRACTCAARWAFRARRHPARPVLHRPRRSPAARSRLHGLRLRDAGHGTVDRLLEGANRQHLAEMTRRAPWHGMRSFSAVTRVLPIHSGNRLS